MRETTRGFDRPLSNKICATKYAPHGSARIATQSLPGAAGMYHPKITVPRADNLKRHPEVTPLSPGVTPAVLHERQLFWQIVAKTEDLVAALRCLTRLGNRHDSGVRHLPGQK